MTDTSTQFNRSKEPPNTSYRANIESIASANSNTGICIVNENNSRQVSPKSVLGNE